MRYIKVLLLVLIFFIVMMFFVQNQTSFAEPVTLKLDLLILPPVESVPLPLYAVMLICFTLGALLVLSMLMWDRVKLSSSAMNARRRANGLEKKLTKTEADLTAFSAKANEIETALKADIEAMKQQLADFDVMKQQLEEKEKALEEMKQRLETSSETENV